MDKKTFATIKKMSNKGATAKEIEVFCGQNGVEFHPLACDLAFGVACNHLTPAQSSAARKAFTGSSEMPEPPEPPEVEPPAAEESVEALVEASAETPVEDVAEETEEEPKEEEPEVEEEPPPATPRAPKKPATARKTRKAK